MLKILTFSDNHQKASHSQVNSEVSNAVHNRPSGQKPVPKKRTKINKPQSSVSDTASSVSTQSISSQNISATADSSIRSPPPRGIPKHSSNEPTLKSQLRQPVVSLSNVHKNIIQEKDPEESKLALGRTEDTNNKTEIKEKFSTPSPMKLPKSRLPVRASSQLINLPQGLQEKPKIQPRLSLNSITRPDDSRKVEEVLIQRKESNGCLPQSPSMEVERQNISGEMHHSVENAVFAFGDNSKKPLNEITAHQHTHHMSENVANQMAPFAKLEMMRTEEKIKKTTTGMICIFLKIVRFVKRVIHPQMTIM